MKSVACEAKSTTRGFSVSRQRRRTIAEAMNVLADAGVSAAKRRTLAPRIERARQPVAEARRIVERQRRGLVRDLAISNQLDLSDVQVIRATLVRRHGRLSAVHADMLARMDRMVAAGELDRAGFERMAAAVLSMPQALPQAMRELHEKPRFA